jgi:hypothetical protein
MAGIYPNEISSDSPLSLPPILTLISSEWLPGTAASLHLAGFRRALFRSC